MAILLLLAGAAGAGQTSEQRCQATKNRMAGKYAYCRQNAEAKLATAGDGIQYSDAVGKCAAKLAAGWQKAIDAAARAGAPCLDEPLTAGDFESAIAEHATNIATALAGGGLATDTCSGVVLRTDQVSSYGPESDGSQLRGAGRSYTDNGDGTITDDTTGLMWEKKSDDDSIHDVHHSYPWGMTSSPYVMNGLMVTTFLATLNAGGGFAGYTDWRIPNVNELRSIASYEHAFPAVGSAFDSGCVAGCSVTECSCTWSSNYWSSTTVQAYPASAWYVGFDVGDTFAMGKNLYGHVRAVRGGS